MLITIRRLQVGATSAEPDPGAATVLLAGTAAAVALAAFAAWRRATGLASDAHRAAVTVLAPFGALALVFLLSMRIEKAAGLPGLGLMAGACGMVGILGDRWARKP